MTSPSFSSRLISTQYSGRDFMPASRGIASAVSSAMRTMTSICRVTSGISPSIR